MTAICLARQQRWFRVLSCTSSLNSDHLLPAKPETPGHLRRQCLHVLQFYSTIALSRVLPFRFVDRHEADPFPVERFGYCVDKATTMSEVLSAESMQACSAALVFIQPTPNQSFELLKELCSFTLSGRGASLPTFSSWCWTLTYYT